MTKVKKINFEKDTKVKPDTTKAELLIKSAREWLDKHEGEVAKKSFTEVRDLLGVGSNSHNLSWLFSPSNRNGPFRELSIKYRVYVGRHNGLDKDVNKQSVTFRNLRVKDIPEEETEIRKQLSG